jgi:hypothetical protein
MCFSVCIAHFMRTLHPKIAAGCAKQFDEDMLRDLAHLITGRESELSERAVTVAHLPVRLGGIGLFSQEALAPYAAVASLVLSMGVLQERSSAVGSGGGGSGGGGGGGSSGYAVCDALKEEYVEYVELCANTLSVQPADLLSLLPREAAHLQKKMLEVVHEVAWQKHFDSLDKFDRVRSLEACGKLSRGWLQAPPTAPPLVLSDEAVRYGLRRILLDEFPDVTQASRVCRYCNLTDSAYHHLQCSKTRPQHHPSHLCVQVPGAWHCVQHHSQGPS